MKGPNGQQFLRIEQGGLEKSTHICRITKYNSATSVDITPAPDITATGLVGNIDLYVKVVSKTNANVAVTQASSVDRNVANTAAFMTTPVKYTYQQKDQAVLLKVFQQVV